MLTYELRLNEIITETPIVSIPEEHTEVDTFLYDSVISAYKYAYVNADNSEQFISDFNSYWNRNIRYYRDMMYNQIAIGENLFTARLETYDGGRDETETPNFTDTEDWTFGRQDKTEYGRTLNITPDITETDNGSGNTTVTPTGNEVTETTRGNTQYNQQIITGTETVTRTPLQKTETDGTTENTHKRTGNEEHTTSGQDTVTQSGSNGRSLTRTGSRTITYKDNRNNKVVVYDTEKFFEALKSGNTLVDKFIDTFAPLFNDILFATGFGGLL